ncbi:nucleoside/nucleotide kinase family protein [Aristophania vespae]|uniref:nucleoside triphosphate hydrolase n=1 Tax=Aristophania vespae TaxID=2697033 RepID=UPI0023513E83|nr:nucleoside triphosphate hydrolase [Aristophania vespae]UMM64058.1 hypothetical protein DM15PD_10400 [Aristophania vespae]
MFDRESPSIEPQQGRKQPVIALIGSDGSGKSTVGQVLYEEMNKNRPTAFCHLGKQAGNLGRYIKTIPIIGPIFTKRNEKEHKRLKIKKNSSFLATFVEFVMSMRRVFRFARMRCYHARGFAILTDRFPQNLIPGPMDGPSLANLSFKGRFLHLLMKIENILYRRMSHFKPDLVIRLNVDLETAMSRKPDHKSYKLARKISDVGRLTFDGAPILDLNATDPLEEVLAQAKKAVASVLEAYPHKTR